MRNPYNIHILAMVGMVFVVSFHHIIEKALTLLLAVRERCVVILIMLLASSMRRNTQSLWRHAEG